ncbi:double-stranded RNA-binding protein 4-like [Diospyros lotus]|uniref:double-stranded RNA-binding protein 4-like n=1 Tax=Diospyros lotus TaxID=55363 RepID=UPI00225025EB|nr:double-stranded RNA-binding protein 4-like [Diospyros lotus]
MYKSKLQELCQQKGWNLPLYSTIKDGSDHNPGFTATVTVDGRPFHSSDHNRTAKEAQNNAAMVAFHHFCGSPNLPPPPAAPSVPPAAPASSSSPSGTVTSLDNTKLLKEAPSGVKDDRKLKDMQHGYKNLLQKYTQMRNLNQPAYSCERKGPPHACRFNSKVTVDGKSYESPEFFSTIKEAEQSAAQVACESLLLNVVQDETGVYKNLLQELAQREGFDMPKYETAVSGLQHSPTFVSTVKVRGKSFIGAAAKNKKQAEINAARVAYIDLSEQTHLCDMAEWQNRDEERTECSEPPAIKEPGPSVLNPIALPSASEIREALEVSSAFLQSVVVDHPEQNVPKDIPIISEEPDEEHLGNRDPFHATASSGEDNVHWPSKWPDYSSNMGLTVGAPVEAGVANTSSPAKVMIFPRGKNVTFPDGAIVLPFSDEKWVALKMNVRK